MTISVTQPREADSKFARDAWLRALAKTANIGQQRITLPELIASLAVEFHANPAIASPEASMSFGNRCVDLGLVGDVEFESRDLIAESFSQR